jgi:hypothetical protein
MGRTILLLTFAMLVCVAVLASTASGTDPQPLPPAQANQLATGGFKSSPPSIARQITPAQAQAIGGGVATAAAGAVCWFNDQLWSEWGIWPYNQKVIEWRTWCNYSLGGIQYYRVSQVHLGTTVCSGSNRFQFLVSGGNGYRYSSIRTGATFTCPTYVPWFSYHYNRWQEQSCNGWGNCALVNHS